MKTLKKEYIKKYQQTKHTKEERKILETIDYPFISKLYYESTVTRQYQDKSDIQINEQK